MTSRKRLNRDYLEIMKNQKEYSEFFDVKPSCTMELNDFGQVVENVDLYHWKGFVFGPTETPYENFKFFVELLFTPEFPMKAPTIKFVTPIYHPNISEKGEVCLNILRAPPAGNWSPALSVSKVLLSVHNLLSDPNGKDPLNIDAGNDFLYNKVRFVEKAMNKCKFNGIKK